jgi:hypothetical protein
LGRTPLGVARRIFGVTFGSARTSQGILRAEDVLPSGTSDTKETATTKSL